MNLRRVFVSFVLVVLLLLQHSESRRFGGFGGSRSSSGGSRSRWGGLFSSKPKPSVTHHSSPKVYKPSAPPAPTNFHQSEIHHSSVNNYKPSAPIAKPVHQNYKPSAPPAETNNPKPIGFVSQPDGHARATNVQPVGSSINNNNGNSRPIGFVVPGTSTSLGSTHSNGVSSNIHQTNVPPSGASNSANSRPIGFVNPGSSTSLGSNINSNVNLNVHHTGGTNTNSRPIGFVAPGTGTSLGASHGTNSHIPITQTNVKPSGNSFPSAGYPQQQYTGNAYPNSHGYNYGYGYGHPGHYQSNGYSNWHPSYPSPSHHYGPVTYINNYGGYTPGYSSYHYSSSDYGSGGLGFFLGYTLGRIGSPSYYHDHYSYSSPHFDHYTVHHYYHNRESVPKEVAVNPNTVVPCLGNSSVLCSTHTTALCFANGTIMCVAKAQETVPCQNDPGAYCIKTEVPCFNKTQPGCEDKNATVINVPCLSNATLFGNISYVNNSIVLNKPINVTSVSGTVTPVNQTVGGDNAIKVPNLFCVTIIAQPAPAKKTMTDTLYERTKGDFLYFINKAWGIS